MGCGIFSGLKWVVVGFSGLWRVVVSFSGFWIRFSNRPSVSVGFTGDKCGSPCISLGSGDCKWISVGE